ncbi:MAG: hypothetical protein ACKOTZ_08125 [Chloroflexota bacterium]
MARPTGIGRTRARHVRAAGALAPAGALALAGALIVSAAGRAASPAPGASPDPAGSAVPAAGADLPDASWTTGVCRAIVLLDAGRERVVGLGHAAGQGDTAALTLAADEAAVIGDAALAELDAITRDWIPGRPLIGALADSAFALVDLGVGMAQADPDDAETARRGLAAAVRALTGFSAAQDALALLPAAAIPDCAGVTLPAILTPADASPLPDADADPVLAAAFPATIDGIALDAATVTGPALVRRTDADDPGGQRRITLLEELLARRGLDLPALSVGFALLVPPDGPGATITAFRVAGADAADLQAELAEVLTVDYLEPLTDEVEVAGRTLLRVSDGPFDPEGVHEVLLPAGGILWAISAPEPLLGSIVATLAAAAP